MTDYDVRAQIALNDCDREPIHIPQAIQGHGLLLVLNLDALTLEQGAGAIEDLTGQTRWIADHTGVPEQHGGKGLAGELVRALIAGARKADVKIIPLCPYVKAWAQKHPEEAEMFD